MKATLKSKLLPGLLVTGMLGAGLLPAQPAAADLLKDATVGAATTVTTGALLNNGKVVRNAATGAAAGAAVSATHNKSNGRVSSVVQDAAVGAVTSVVSGKILRNGKTLDNAVGGAAAGAVVNSTRR